jgi:hypothetical protein
MKKENFNTGFAGLVNGYAYAGEKVPAATQDVYWAVLQDIPDDLWEAGVKKCLAECKFFPTIHELGVACLGEVKEHMEDRCDPLRSRQNYQVRIEGVSWTENLAKELERRNPTVALPKQPRPALPAPQADERLKAQLRAAKEELQALKLENQALLRAREILRIADAKPSTPSTPEERKRLLAEQARSLGAVMEASLVRKVIDEESQ